MALSLNGNSLDSSSKASQSNHGGLVIVYVVFGLIAMFVYHQIAEGEFSSVLTLSAILQCLAFSLLGMQMLYSDSAHGISAKSLKLDAIALACRLSSTIWLEGYLPNDETGDWLYQAFDAVSLGMVLFLFQRVLSAHGKTYDVDADALPMAPFVLGSLVLAAVFHGDLDDRPVFDTLWMCGLFVSAVAVLPQLWMMTHGRSSVPALTSHFVAVMAFARVLSGSYMWYAHPEITCEPWIGDFQHAGYAILAGHAVHLLFLGDFAYYYVKNLATSGLQAPLDLGIAWEV